MNSKSFSYVGSVLGLFFAFCLYGSVMNSFGQKENELTRSAVVIDQRKAHVYLCEEGPLVKNRNNSRIRFVNNSVWTLSFFVEEGSRSQTLIKLSNGSNVAASESGSLVSPVFGFEAKTEKSVKHPRTWPSLVQASYLRSGSFIRFDVPREIFKKFDIYIEYAYEWELTGPLATESHGPKHRVFIGKAAADSLMLNECQ